MAGHEEAAAEERRPWQLQQQQQRDKMAKNARLGQTQGDRYVLLVWPEQFKRGQCETKRSDFISPHMASSTGGPPTCQ